MTEEKKKKDSQLILSLREGVGLVQMIVFKQIRESLLKKNCGGDQQETPMLAGAITNEIFGTRNPDPRFALFRKEHRGEIEQQLLGLKDDHEFLCRHITDALRIQTLCDDQEGGDSTDTLVRAKNYGYLLEDREIPLPSTFMTVVRELGRQHNLIVPPVQITPDQDESMVH
ncbi:hypothetical protein [Desulforhopalus singaporensis]|uniref:Uncharacterized protein n=1 Tax=Desulforhopalus singaporensis TaxID=91360 RepID=A0A1H0UNS1_9BACT|nr:hypothetical protein [Desulforhopalus singaporensis]SDP67781.1 hypothetical protein SAMN05660330_03654 [Desulforhopalus singaporensis]